MRKLQSCLMVFLLFVFFANGQSSLDQKVARAIATMECAAPTERDPLTLNAMVVSDGDSLAVIIKANMAPDWHIYQHVPPNAPYVQLENILSLPKGLSAVGKWRSSDPVPYVSDPTVLIHEGEAWFVQKIVGKKEQGSSIKAGLYYQICDHRQCLPPEEITVEIKIE